MKKTFGLLVLLFVIVLASPLGPARADDFTNGDIVTVTPSLDADEVVFGLQFMEYLRQGGSVDFSNTSSEYTLQDFSDDFTNLCDEIANNIPSPLDEIINNTRQSIKLYPNMKLKNRIGVMRNNLPNYLNNNGDNKYPEVNQDYQFIFNINNLYTKDYVSINRYSIYNVNTFYNSNNTRPLYPIQPYSNCSLVIDDAEYAHTINENNPIDLYYSISTTFISIYITNNIGGGCSVSYTGYTPISAKAFFNNTTYLTNNNQVIHSNYLSTLNGVTYNAYMTSAPTFDRYIFETSNFNSLLEALNYIYKHYSNIDLYVDGIQWVYHSGTSYNVGLGTGTYLKETNQPIEYNFSVDVYFDLDDILDKIELSIENKVSIDFTDFEDMIVDVDGQRALAVKIFQEDYTIDDLYLKDYGAMVPVFPLFVDYPVSLQSINNVATVGVVDVVPDEILQIFGMFLIGGLFVLLCHRLME